MHFRKQVYSCYKSDCCHNYNSTPFYLSWLQIMSLRRESYWRVGPGNKARTNLVIVFYDSMQSYSRGWLTAWILLSSLLSMILHSRRDIWCQSGHSIPVSCRAPIFHYYKGQTPRARMRGWGLAGRARARLKGGWARSVPVLGNMGLSDELIWSRRLVYSSTFLFVHSNLGVS